jgi:hypothetical protein
MSVKVGFNNIFIAYLHTYFKSCVKGVTDRII